MEQTTAGWRLAETTNLINLVAPRRPTLKPVVTLDSHPQHREDNGLYNPTIIWIAINPQNEMLVLMFSGHFGPQKNVVKMMFSHVLFWFQLWQERLEVQRAHGQKVSLDPNHSQVLPSLYKRWLFFCCKACSTAGTPKQIVWMICLGSIFWKEMDRNVLSNMISRWSICSQRFLLSWRLKNSQLGQNLLLWRFWEPPTWYTDTTTRLWWALWKPRLLFWSWSFRIWALEVAW